jgi:hypothetical protein
MNTAAQAMVYTVPYMIVPSLIYLYSMYAFRVGHSVVTESYSCCDRPYWRMNEVKRERRATGTRKVPYRKYYTVGERTGKKSLHVKTDLILRSRKADELWVEFLDVFSHLFHSVPVKIQNLREMGDLIWREVAKQERWVGK